MSEQEIDPDETVVSEQLLDVVLDTMKLTGRKSATQVRERLRTIASDFLIDRSIAPYFGSPKEQRVALRHLRKTLDKALDATHSIAPEYGVALDAMIPGKFMASGVQLAHTQDAMKTLRDAINRFDDAYQPKQGAPTDLPLETAVRSLARLFRLGICKLPAVQMNKHKGANPRLASPGAQAIGRLLRGLDPKLTETKIANMIVKVGSQCKESESHLDALIRLGDDTDLDASLLPGRPRD